MGCSTLKKHLEFKKLPLEKGRKMSKYEVWNKLFDDKIGIIHWRGGWRQYVFRADPLIDMTRSCHREVDTFIDNLMDEWKHYRATHRIKNDVNSEDSEVKNGE